jgi:hypothetical protein
MTAHRDNPCDFGALSVTSCVVDGEPGVRITLRDPAGEVVLLRNDARRLQSCLMNAIVESIEMATREAAKRKRAEGERSGV